MSYYNDGSQQKSKGTCFCDGTKGIVNYMLHQHVPKSNRRMNEFLPHHLYYDRVTVPFDMKSIPASNICNRSVIKRLVFFKSMGDGFSKNTPRSVAWMPENNYVITAWSNGMIVKFEGVTYLTGSQKSFSNTGINCLCLSHNGRYLIAADESGRINCMPPTLNTDISSKWSIKEKDEIKDCAFSANDNYVIVGGKGKILKICSVNDQGLSYDRDLGEHNNTITSITSSAVGSMVISGSEDTTAHIWDLRQKRSVKRIQGHTDVVNKVAFCPTNENYFISASNDKTVKLFDVRTYCCVNTFEGHHHHVTAAAFNPVDGTLFASGDYFGSINFFSIYNSRPIYAVNRAHVKCIRDICYNPMGLGMVTIADDSMVRFWQRNRPGDCEELIASNFVPFKIPRNGYYSTTKESFSISRDIPSLGKIEDDQITTINIQAPVKEERPLSIEERHEQAKDFLEDDRILPPRSYVCVKCNKNGHWPHLCDSHAKAGRRNYVVSCNKCHGKHTSDVCPYRYEVSSSYVCNFCKGKGHYVDECPRKLMMRKKITTAETSYTNRIRSQEGEVTVEES